MKGILYNKTDDLPGRCEGKEGVVYIIEQHGRFKIGRTVNPRHRIKGIETLIGWPLAWIVVFEPCLNYKEAEAAMHGEFAQCRQNGEWFLCNPMEICDALGEIEPLKQDHDAEVERIGAMINRMLGDGL